MIISANDNNNDWTFGKGLQNYKSGLDAIIQNVETKLKEWKRNCFFNVDGGVDYENYLDIGTKDFLDLDIKRVILQSEGIIIINSFVSSITNRDYNCQANVKTIYGIETIGV